MLTGENGILTQAQNAKKETERAKIIEEVRLDILGKQTENGSGDISADELEEILKKYFSNEEQNLKDIIAGTSTDKLISKEDETIKIDLSEIYNGAIEDEEEQTGPQPTPEPEPGGSIETMANGVIEIRWLTGDTNIVSETANAPVIGSNLPANTIMKLVKYQEGENGAEGTWVEGTDYEYKEGSGTADNTSSRWANAEVEIDGVKSYFVWIPRYAYRIIYFNSEDTKKDYLENGDTSGIIGYSDSRGIVDKDGKKVDGVASTTSINVGDYFRVHPAFINDSSNNYESGGWNEELPGIWVGKYESSLVSKATPDTTITSGTNIIVDSTNNTDKAIAVKLGMSSWRSCTIGNMYTSAKAYSTNLNSHMLKNSEWGAVAYLTHSQYGRNGTEVTKNGNSSYITADEGISANPEQSSTGNVYGIYDLSGGAFEYVAAYLEEGSTSNGSSLVDETDKKMVTAYTGTSESSDYKLGDATYETKNWHGDGAYFVNSSLPFFMRGCNFNYGPLAGVFYFVRGDGDAVSDSSFRMCLAVK